MLRENFRAVQFVEKREYNNTLLNVYKCYHGSSTYNTKEMTLLIDGIFDVGVCTIFVLCFMLWLYFVLYIIKIPENDLELISEIEPEIVISYIESVTETAEVTDNLSVETKLNSVQQGNTDIETEEKQEYESLGEYILTAYCPCIICCGEYSAEHPDSLALGQISFKKPQAAPFHKLIERLE